MRKSPKTKVRLNTRSVFHLFWPWKLDNPIRFDNPIRSAIKFATKAVKTPYLYVKSSKSYEYKHTLRPFGSEERTRWRWVTRREPHEKILKFKNFKQVSIFGEKRLKTNKLLRLRHNLRRSQKTQIYKIFCIFTDSRLFPFYSNLAAIIQQKYKRHKWCEVSIRWKHTRVSNYAEYLIYLYLLRWYQVIVKAKLFDSLHSFFTKYCNFCLKFLNFNIFWFLYFSC